MTALRAPQRGFLLMEALVSLALLGLGVMAMTESFWITQQERRRERLARRVSACLDERAWMVLSDVRTDTAACGDGVTVRTDNSAFSTAMIRIQWTVSAREAERTYETTAESFLPAL